MERNKTERGYKFLCLGLVGIICIMLTGAGNEECGQQYVKATSDKLLTEASEIYMIQDQRIALEDIVTDDCILRITYDLHNENENDVGVIKGFNGEKELLGTKLEYDVACIAEKNNLNSLFPSLKFEGYSWIDEEKSMGIVSLVLSDESKRDFEQMRNTVLYEQLDKETSLYLNEDSDSVQKVEIAMMYNIEIPNKFLNDRFSVDNSLKITRCVNVITPEVRN